MRHETLLEYRITENQENKLYTQSLQLISHMKMVLYSCILQNNMSNFFHPPLNPTQFYISVNLQNQNYGRIEYIE